MAFVAIIGVLLVIFPQISAWLGFDFKITLLVLWIPLIFDIMVLMPLFGKFNYSEEEFEYTNVFGFTRIFQYKDILKLIETKRRVKIVTANKKICVWKGFCGAEAFIDFLKEKIDRSKL